MRNNLYKLFGNVFPAIAVVSLILAACSSEKVAGGASGDAGVVAIKDLDVAGLAQKGPFVKGSDSITAELPQNCLIEKINFATSQNSCWHNPGVHKY